MVTETTTLPTDPQPFISYDSCMLSYSIKGRTLINNSVSKLGHKSVFVKHESEAELDL